MMENIQAFLSALQDRSSRLHPVYWRNFRELIKVIPAVGSWIDANTAGALEDAALQERLENLDAACSRALRLEEATLLQQELANINSLFFVVLFTNLKEIGAQDHQISEKIDQLLALARGGRAETNAHPQFRFVTLSGASATGKDCILDLILSHSGGATVNVEALTKFTTRTPRVVDSKYYDFITDDQFNLLEQSGNLIFPYYKRGARYGFDRTHLSNAARDPGVLFSVFTHFESLPADRQFLRNDGINHLAVLLVADLETLRLRSDGRLLPTEDRERRKSSISVDLNYIEENGVLIEREFDLIVDNGDSHSKYETHDRIVRFVGLPELAFGRVGPDGPAQG